MHTTRQLAWYTLHEPWGDKNSLLFKYLDYTFRCAAFRDEVYTFEEKIYSTTKQQDIDELNNIDTFPIVIPGEDNNEDISSLNDRSESRLIFNTGLII